MTNEGLRSCPVCQSVLTAWEKRCACTGPQSTSIKEVLYAIACNTSQPLYARDFVRNAERDHRSFFMVPTAVAMLSDRRFCWAGKGLYGLYRHGPLPGPRNLEEAARVVLVAAEAPLGEETLNFCLKQLGYRFSIGSLRNAMGRSQSLTWLNGFWDTVRGGDGESDLLHEIPIVPLGELNAWGPLRTQIGAKVTRAREEFRARLGAVGDFRFGLDWEST